MKPLFSFRGKVVAGKKRGRTLGFPTANLRLRKTVPEGIYFSLTKVDNLWYKSLTFVGTAKTFAEKDYRAETFILSFDKNLINRYITVRLLKKHRNNQKFSDATALTKAMKDDLKAAEQFFK